MNALLIPAQQNFNFHVQWNNLAARPLLPMGGTTRTDLVNANNASIDNRGSVSNDIFSLGPNSNNVNVLAGPGSDIFEYLNGRGTKNTVLNGGAGIDTLRLNTTDIDLINDLRHTNTSFVQYDNGFGLRGADGQEVKVFNTEQIAFNNRSYNLQNPRDVEQLVAALQGNSCNPHDPHHKPVKIIDERSKNINNNCGCGPKHHHPFAPTGLTTPRGASNFTNLDLSNSNNYLVFNDASAQHQQGFQPQVPPYGAGIADPYYGGLLSGFLAYNAGYSYNPYQTSGNLLSVGLNNAYTPQAATYPPANYPYTAPYGSLVNSPAFPPTTIPSYGQGNFFNPGVF